MTTTDTTNKVVTIEGKLIKARREAKKYHGHVGTEKFHITLAEVKELSDEDFNACLECYKDSGNKFVPSWLKEWNGFVNLSTIYDIPVLFTDGNRGASLEDAIDEGFPFMKSKVRLSLSLKEGAIYPKAIKILENGQDYDPYEGL